jgi:hypothetical protein
VENYEIFERGKQKDKIRNGIYIEGGIQHLLIQLEEK